MRPLPPLQSRKIKTNTSLEPLEISAERIALPDVVLLGEL